MNECKHSLSNDGNQTQISSIALVKTPLTRKKAAVSKKTAPKITIRLAIKKPAPKKSTRVTTRATTRATNKSKRSVPVVKKETKNQKDILPVTLPTDERTN